jgi:uncharacterized protein (TIGR03000 family)
VSAQVAEPFGFFRRGSAWAVFPPASNYGYNLFDAHPGYYGGGDYREYYAFGRGYGVANFPGPVPGPEYYWDWTAPWRREFRLRPPPPDAHEFVTDGPPVVAAVPAAGSVVYFTVEVPADAEVYLEGVKTKQTGPNRLFVSPQLTPGKQYGYEIRAAWTEDGRKVERLRHLMVSAGQRLTVSFVEPPATAAQPSPRRFPVDVEQ